MGKNHKVERHKFLKTQTLQGGESIKSRMLKTTYQILEKGKDQSGKRKIESGQWGSQKVYSKPVVSTYAVGQ